MTSPSADGKVVKLGDLAQYVLDKRIPLEICLISNVHTGATPSLAEHPFKILYQEKFRVTLNTDNRLMSDTTMTKEFEAAANTFGLSLDDFEKITINAMKSAFLPYDQRCHFIYSVIKPGYAKIRESKRIVLRTENQKLTTDFIRLKSIATEASRTEDATSTLVDISSKPASGDAR